MDRNRRNRLAQALQPPRRSLMAGSVLAAASVAAAPAGAARLRKPAAAERPPCRSVSFENNGISMAGNLYLPASFNEAGKYAAIVSVHPGGGVKEQTAGLYAQKLAEQGFVTLAFDAGPPRRQWRRAPLPRRPDEARRRHLQRGRLPDLAPLRGREPHRRAGRLRRQRNGRSRPLRPSAASRPSPP